jgi:hypothetical protein
VLEQDPAVVVFIILQIHTSSVLVVDQFYQHPLVNVENSMLFELLRLLRTMGENFGAAETIRYVVAIEFKFSGSNLLGMKICQRL